MATSAAKQIVTVQFASESQSGRSGSLVLNGQDISKFCRAVKFESSVDSISTATIEIIPRDGFELSMPAGVELHVTPWPGFVLVEEQTADGGKRWRTVREAQEPA